VSCEGVEVQIGKLSKQDVIDLTSQYQKGESTTTELAKEYGISQSGLYWLLKHKGLCGTRVKRLEVGDQLKIVSLYEQGMSSLAIARMLDVDNSTVFRTLRRYDKASRSISEANGGVKSEIIPEVCEKYQRGSMSKDLAAEYGVSQSTIARILNRNGVELRGRGGYDNIEHALKGEKRFSPVRKTFLYVYTLKRFPGYLKIGISVDPPHRAENPEYGESLLHPPYEFDSRVEAYFLESVILQETVEFAMCPEELEEKWNGWTEVRNIDFEALTEVVEWAFNELSDLGVWQFGYFHVPMTELQRQQCLEMAQGPA